MKSIVLALILSWLTLTWFGFGIWAVFFENPRARRRQDMIPSWCFVLIELAFAVIWLLGLTLLGGNSYSYWQSVIKTW